VVTVTDRAQGVTLEAFLAVLTVIGAPLFAMQTASVTPLSASSTNAHLENQNRGLASGALNAAVENGSLEPTLRYWNETNASFFEAHRRGYYPNDGPPTAFGRLLDRSLTDQGLAYNVLLSYLSKTGQPRQIPLVYVGAPSENAVSVSRTVLLTDEDVLFDRTVSPTNTTVAESTTYFAPDASPNSSTYNIVRVEVVVWRA
jgi:hypothetical protein